MKLKQVLKMLSKDEDWKYVTPFSFDPDMIEVKHKSGIYYYKCTHAIVLRRSAMKSVFVAGVFSHILTNIASRLLERKLNKKINPT